MPVSRARSGERQRHGNSRVRRHRQGLLENSRGGGLERHRKGQFRTRRNLITHGGWGLKIESSVHRVSGEGVLRVGRDNVGDGHRGATGVGNGYRGVRVIAHGHGAEGQLGRGRFVVGSKTCREVRRSCSGSIQRNTDGLN